MFPLYITLFSAAMFMSIFAITQPESERVIIEVTASARINKLLNQRKAAGEFFTANPLSVGVIPGSALLPYFELGGLLDADIVSEIQLGQVYTYTLMPARAGDIDRLGKQTNCSEASGMVLPGDTFRPSCQVSTLSTPALPVLVSAGSLITIGR